MAKGARDLRRFPTAYEAKQELPELASWMSDDALKLLPVWRGTRFENGQIYFDLDHPDYSQVAAAQFQRMATFSPGAKPVPEMIGWLPAFPLLDDSDRVGLMVIVRS